MVLVYHHYGLDHSLENFQFTTIAYAYTGAQRSLNSHYKSCCKTLHHLVIPSSVCSARSSKMENKVKKISEESQQVRIDRNGS